MASCLCLLCGERWSLRAFVYPALSLGLLWEPGAWWRLAIAEQHWLVLDLQGDHRSTKCPQDKGDATTEQRHACTSSIPTCVRRPRAGTSPYCCGGLSGSMPGAAIKHFGGAVRPALRSLLVQRNDPCRRALGSLGPREQHGRAGPTKEQAEAVATMFGSLLVIGGERQGR